MEKVSVIIPFYNNELFLAKAIDSVLKQKEVGQIILIDDASTDSSLKIANDYQKNFQELILIVSTPNHKNQGAAVARNLGIQHSKFELLAFLDADDFYLENRFVNAMEILQQKSNADGVYEAIGTYYYDEEGKRLHEKRMTELNIPDLDVELTTFTQKVEPEQLFSMSLIGNCGWFHFNGLTVRKSIFEKCGLLDPFMRYGQDTELFLRMALYGSLFPGNLKIPVAMRGIYNNNRTLSIFTSNGLMTKDHLYNAYMWKKMFRLMLNCDFERKVNQYLLNRYLDYYNSTILKMPINFKRKVYKFLIYLGVLLEHPTMIVKLIK